MERTILLLGNPRLRESCAEIADFRDPGLPGEIADLQETLDGFRRSRGFGRGLAAPQVGINKRIIALNLGQGTFAIFNPRITARSGETFSLWDDCLSFPDLLVRVRRHRSVSLAYQDESGAERRREGLDQAEAELLQHEIDHLDGILAVDRAAEVRDIIYRSEFERDRAFYERQVDYVIRPTTG